MDQASQLRKLMKEPDSYSPKPTLIAVASGKGGVGKSTLTLNLGVALAKAGSRVAIFDLDIGFGNLETLLGANAKYSMNDVKEGVVSLKEAFLEGPYGIHILAGGSGLSTISEWHQEEVNRFLTEVARMDVSYDVILFDTGAGLTDMQKTILQAVDQTFVVTTPEPPAMTDAYSLVKLMAATSPDFSFQLIVNQCSSLVEGNQSAKQFEQVCAEFLNCEVEIAGFIMKDADISVAVKKQIPYFLYAPKGSAARSIERLAFKLRGFEPRDKNGVVGFISRWMTFR